jgi:hypothetical protein
MRKRTDAIVDAADEGDDRSARNHVEETDSAFETPLEEQRLSQIDQMKKRHHSTRRIEINNKEMNVTTR